MVRPVSFTALPVSVKSLQLGLGKKEEELHVTKETNLHILVWNVSSGVAGTAELRLNNNVKSREGTHTDSEQVRRAVACLHLHTSTLLPPSVDITVTVICGLLPWVRGQSRELSRIGHQFKVMLAYRKQCEKTPAEVLPEMCSCCLTYRLACAGVFVLVIRNKRETQAKEANHFAPPAAAGAVLPMSKWKMTTSQAVSIRSASAARGGFLLVDSNMLLFWKTHLTQASSLFTCDLSHPFDRIFQCFSAD